MDKQIHQVGDKKVFLSKVIQLKDFVTLREMEPTESFGFWMHKHPTVTRKERIISLDCKTDLCAAELGSSVGDNKTTEREGRQ